MCIVGRKLPFKNILRASLQCLVHVHVPCIPHANKKKSNTLWGRENLIITFQWSWPGIHSFKIFQHTSHNVRIFVRRFTRMFLLLRQLQKDVKTVTIAGSFLDAECLSHICALQFSSYSTNGKTWLLKPSCIRRCVLPGFRPVPNFFEWKASAGGSENCFEALKFWCHFLLRPSKVLN